MGKIFVGDTSIGEKFSWMEANHENNEIKSTTKIFTYTVIVCLVLSTAGSYRLCVLMHAGIMCLAIHR